MMVMMTLTTVTLAGFEILKFMLNKISLILILILCPLIHI